MSFITTGGVVNAPFYAGGITYGTGSGVNVATAGTVGASLLSGGTGAPTWGVPADSSGLLGGGVNQVPYNSAVNVTNFASPVAGGVFYSLGTTNPPAFTAAGTAGSLLYSTGTTAPAFNTPGSAGSVLYSTGSSAPAFSAVGTTGQVLTSAGAGTPTWNNPSSGAMVLISTLTASTSTNLTWTGLTGYDSYLLTFSNILPQTVARTLLLRIGNSGGILTAGYNFRYQVFENSTSTFGGTVSSYITLVNTIPVAGTTSGDGGGSSGYFVLTGMSRTSAYMAISGTAVSFATANSTPSFIVASGSQPVTGVPYTQIQLLTLPILTGTFSGSASLYGITS